MHNTLLTVLFSGFLSTTAFASDNHSDHSNHANHEAADHQAMDEGVEAQVTIHSMEGNTVNLSHGPIPEIGWPAMTMDLQLIEGANVGDVAEGEGAVITLEKGEDGMYAIRELMPIE